jgi:Carbohydrate-selective porin, OprB family/S-layer homology domain
MNRFQLSILGLLPLMAGVSFAPSANAADETMQQMLDYSATHLAEAQVTSVSQLSDVKPTDWAFQALQSLVERYGCIAGYPDKTYRGNRAMTRYEFAAGLNACMDRVNELIAASTKDMATKEDLATLQKMQEEFATELAEIRGKVDGLEVKVATLDKQQFSTTTKLKGEVIFGVEGVLGNRRAVASNTPNPGTGLSDNTVLSDRVRLSLDTSFTGKDRLRTRLQAQNTPNFSTATGTNMARLGFDGTNSNAVEIDKLYYRTPLSDNLTVQVEALNTEVYDGLVQSLSPFESSGTGAISRYGRFTPNLRAGINGAGASVEFKLNDKIKVQGAYIAGNGTDSSNPATKNGLFNGSSKAFGQIVVQPTDSLQIAALYGNAYYKGGAVNVTAGTGSGFAGNPFNNSATKTDEVAVQALYKMGKQVELGGWYGWQFADQLRSPNNATITNWAAFAAFKDLGGDGNLAGIIFGQPPKVTSNDAFTTGTTLLRKDSKTSYHLELLYKYKLNDKIAVTPGLLMIFNPEGNKNDTIYVGTLRTTFSF